MGLTSGKIILENPIARHSYIRIQEHGTIVNYINNPSSTTFGFWDGGRNEIKINLARANTPQEIVVTLVHEGAHQTRSFRGFTSVTKAEEYFAFRRELLFNLNRRPTLAERLDLWEKIKHSDEYSSIPMGVPPFKNRSKP